MVATQVQDSYLIQDREVRLPVAVRDATAAVGYYLASASAAQKLIAPTGLRIAQTLPGKTLCTIGAMNYKDGDLGQYYEIAVTFFVHEQGARSVPLIGTALGFMRGNIAAYIHRLPVNGEFTCEAGRSIWGFPKVITDISLTTDGDEEAASLEIDGRHVLTQTMRMTGSRSFPTRRQISYSYLDGVLRRTPSTMTGEDICARFRGAKLTLGSHPIADELRALGLGKRSMFSTYIGKMTGEFFAAETRPPQGAGS
jgi:hypothetical protein